VIITRKDTQAIETTKDLAGKKIAVQKGTTNEEQAKTFTQPNLVLTYDNFEEATNALLTASADAIFSDLTGAKGIIGKNPSLRVASDPFTNEEYGIVFRKGEDDLVTEINTILKGLRQQGVLTYLRQKWLD
jgi:ABC-type amino acid transport substrate-binding protein